MPRGTRRERQVRELLETDGWVCLRAAGSLGPVDILAMKRGMPPRMCQVKSDYTSPWKNMGPAARQRLHDVAYQAGCEAWVCWWPPRGPLAWISPDAWP